VTIPLVKEKGRKEGTRIRRNDNIAEKATTAK